MKSLKIVLFSCLILLFASCESDDGASGTAVFAVPVVKSLSEIRNSVSISEAVATNSHGKIYVTENNLFYIAKETGVHVFNNTNPASPQNIAFINIEGVHDIAVKDHYLYADNYVDLLVFDIADINNITLVQTLQNSISFYPTFPESAQFYDYSMDAGAGEIVTGFTLETRARPQYTTDGGDLMTSGEVQNQNAAVGTGGSFAKFQINKNALYTVDSYQLNVFNISNPEATFFDKAVYMETWFGGGQLETLFRQKDFLFVGATNGMQIVDATDEFNPVFISGFSHATACDPVVVNDHVAYITVRGGTSCGAIEDQVNVLDISNITNPTLLSTYLLGQPYGLGFESNILYVCCGSDGLKVFDASNNAGLTLKNSYPQNVTDVIALGTHLIAVGDNKIIQYNYGPNFTLVPLSTVNF